MSGNPAQKGCSCGGGAPTEAGPSARGMEIAKVLKAQVRQEYEAKFNRRHPGQRRRGAASLPAAAEGTRLERAPSAIDPGVLAVLKRADKTLVAWLAKDAANAQRSC